MDAAIDACTHKALGAQFIKQRQVFAFAFAHDRGQQHQLGALGHRQHLVDHLADGLRCQRQVMVRAARLADAGKQQAQVVVNFGNGAHGRTRVVRGGFLLDGNRRRQAFDMVDIGLFHHR